MKCKINETGMAEIREFLRVNHKFFDLMNDNNFHAWAQDAEWHFMDGSGAYIVIPAYASVDGTSKPLEISDNGIDRDAGYAVLAAIDKDNQIHIDGKEHDNTITR